VQAAEDGVLAPATADSTRWVSVSPIE
jgi:hypothetical protein